MAGTTYIVKLRHFNLNDFSIDKLNYLLLDYLHYELTDFPTELLTWLYVIEQVWYFVIEIIEYNGIVYFMHYSPTKISYIRIYIVVKNK